MLTKVETEFPELGRSSIWSHPLGLPWKNAPIWLFYVTQLPFTSLFWWAKSRCWCFLGIIACCWIPEQPRQRYFSKVWSLWYQRCLGPSGECYFLLPNCKNTLLSFQKYLLASERQGDGSKQPLSRRQQALVTRGKSQINFKSHCKHRTIWCLGAFFVLADNILGSLREWLQCQFVN